MRVFKTKWFVAFARGERIRDDALCEAIERAERGLIDADLGGKVIKQRVARPSQGRSGGYRVLIAYERGIRAVFIFGFAKNERDNIRGDEVTVMREVAADWLQFDDTALQQALDNGRAEEVHCG